MTKGDALLSDREAEGQQTPTPVASATPAFSGQVGIKAALLPSATIHNLAQDRKPFSLHAV